jgi:hypothetical protein
MNRKLNLPILDDLADSKRIMVVGLGGGFDLIGAVPIIVSLGESYESIVLVNLSPKSDFLLRESTEEDYPEGLLPNVVRGLEGKFTVGRHGVQLVRKAYKHIIDSLNIDAVIGIDGGVDSLMRGDELNAGTILEDFVALAALRDFDCKKILACVGFGSETEEELNHYRVLENIAALSKSGHFLGTCSLTKDMLSYEYYRAMCKEIMENRRKSHIQTKIISAVEGEFGDHHMYDDVDARVYNEYKGAYFISPLTGMYWFFKMEGVISANLMIEHLIPSNTFADAMMLLKQNRSLRRSKEVIPL